MQGHAKIDLPRTAVENGANAHDLPLMLLRYPHNLAHRTSSGGDILDHQHPFPRCHRKSTAQGHDPALTLAKDGPHPQGPGYFLPNDNTAHRWRDHHIHRGAMKAVRNPASQGLRMLGIL